MIRSTVNVKLTKEFKEKALQVISDTIDKSLIKNKATISDKDKIKIRNFSLDQVNIDVAYRNKLRNMWVFDAEEYIPVLVLVEKKIKHSFLKDDSDDRVFFMETNGDWKAKTNAKGGVNKDEFQKIVLRMILEDFETAAFYGTLSYVDGGSYEQRK